MVYLHVISYIINQSSYIKYVNVMLYIVLLIIVNII